MPSEPPQTTPVRSAVERRDAASGEGTLAPLALAIIAALAAVSVLGARALGGFEQVELAAYDQCLRWRSGAIEQDGDVAVIGFDDEDLARWSWPVPDGVLDKVISNAFSAGAAVVAVDIYRDKAVPPGTDALSRTFRSNPALVAAMKYPSEKGEGVAAPAAVRESDINRIGFTDMVPDTDGFVRRGLLYLGGPGGVETGLALQAARLLLERRGITPEAASGSDGELQLGAAQIRRLSSDFGGYHRINAEGYQVLLDFRRAPGQVPQVRARDVFDGGPQTARLAGKIVFIGVTSEQVKDYFYLPVAGSEETRATFGVVLHALAADQILRLAQGQGRVTRALAPWQEALAIMAAAIFVVLLVARQRRPVAVLGTGFTTTLLLLGVGYLGLVNDWWLPSVPVAATALLTSLSVLSWRALLDRRERVALARLLTSQVSSQVAQELWDNRRTILKGLKPRPARLTATVLFVDIAGSTTVADHLDPDRLVEWVSDFLEEMAEAVQESNGVIEKFTGDGLMAVFGIPVPRTSEGEIARDAENAVQCALRMGRRLDRLNARILETDLPQMKCRVGIHTGPLSAGSVGTRARMQYTVIGQTANLAARLEGFGKDDRRIACDDEGRELGCRILASAATVELLSDSYDVQSMGELELRGAQAPMTVYRVLDSAPS